MVPLLTILYTPVEGIGIAAVAGLVESSMLLPEALKHVNWRETGPVSKEISLSIPFVLTFLTAGDPILIRNGMVFLLKLPVF